LVSAAVRFVLVRPRNPLNAGAAARALANFGFCDLCAVDPYGPVWKEATSAVGAEDILARAPALSLDEALADAHLVLGTHDGRRKGGPEVVDLPDLGEFLSAHLPARGTLALLFGSEKTGLDNKTLSRCRAVIRVPTSARQPSMNLSQAVAVVAYELAMGRDSVRTRSRPAALPPAMTDAQREAFVRDALALARRLGWRPNDTDALVAQKFRDILLRRPLTRDEAATLQALLRRLRPDAK
jgi:tRNA/rRNA methyltransferase